MVIYGSVCHHDVCKKCFVEKPFSEYYKAKGTKTGLHSSCKDCYKQRTNAYKKANADLIASKSKEYYLENKETILTKNLEYHENNPVSIRKAKKKWKERNPHKVTACTAKRRAAKLNATPMWLTKEHFKEIDMFYWLAKDLKSVSGEEYHVDHILPLQGKNVCGLHVPWNLQVLPADLNLSKNNKT